MQQLDYEDLHNLAPGKHLYQFFKSTQDYLPIMFRFFESGLTLGDKGLFLVSQSVGVEHVRETLEKDWPQLLPFVQFGQFEIGASEDYYLTEGRFDLEGTIRRYKAKLKSLLAGKVRYLRLAADIYSSIPIEDLILFENYESQVEAYLSGLPLIIVCAYPIQECSLQTTKSVLQTHHHSLEGQM